MIPDISLAMDYVRELHPRDLPKLIERVEALTSKCWEYKFGKTIITVDSNRNRVWIESAEYGHYTYAWGRQSESSIGFLTRLNKDYVLGKFRIKEVFDKIASFAELRKALREVDLQGESEFEYRFKNEITHIQSICNSSNDFTELISELNSGWRSQYHLLNDDTIQVEFENILSEPWNFICTKESLTARKLWKDFQKLQNKLKEEAQCG